MSAQKRSWQQNALFQVNLVSTLLKNTWRNNSRYFVTMKCFDRTMRKLTFEQITNSTNLPANLEVKNRQGFRRFCRQVRLQSKTMEQNRRTDERRMKNSCTRAILPRPQVHPAPQPSCPRPRLPSLLIFWVFAFSTRTKKVHVLVVSSDVRMWVCVFVVSWVCMCVYECVCEALKRS